MGQAVDRLECNGASKQKERGSDRCSRSHSLPVSLNWLPLGSVRLLRRPDGVVRFPASSLDLDCSDRNNRPQPYG